MRLGFDRPPQMVASAVLCCGLGLSLLVVAVLLLLAALVWLPLWVLDAVARMIRARRA